MTPNNQHAQQQPSASPLSSPHQSFPSKYPLHLILSKERQSSNIGSDTSSLGTLLASPGLTSHQLELLSQIPSYPSHPISHPSRFAQFIHSLHLSRYAHTQLVKYNIDPQVPQNDVFINFMDKIDEPIPLFMHYVMFVPTLDNQADETQRRMWLDDARHGRILGCYAQTEIGHGSNVRGLLTTATFDHDTDQFVIHTPCVEACKFWIGALGKTATHAILMADLIIPANKGKPQKSYGMHAFFVPLRDPDTFDTLPGVEVWDLGDKFGFHSMDNGMMKLNQYRIPRRNMLMRFAQVTRDGDYVRPKVDKLTYGTMVSTRAYLVAAASRHLSKAITISIRYSAQRSQFWQAGDDGRDGSTPVVIDGTTPETSVLNYLTQQHRLFSVLAETYAFMFTGHYMRQMYTDLMAQMKSGDFSTLAELHGTTAGLKSYVTARVLDDIDVCRKTCGGHGFSNLSGLPQIFGDFAAEAIAEGEEYVLSFQTGRFCLKTFSQVLKATGKECEDLKLGETVNYMKDSKVLLQSTLDAQSVDDLLEDPFQEGQSEDDDVLINILRFKALQLLSQAVTKYQKLTNGQQTNNTSAVDNEMGMDLYRIMKAHCACTVALCFKRHRSKILKLTPESRRAITALYQLYCLNRIEEDISPYVLDGFMNKQQVLLVQDAVRKLLRQIRPDAVPLVDAFNIPDETLRSVLGKYNGDAYRHLFEEAKNSEFNHGKAERILKATLMREIQPILRSKI